MKKIMVALMAIVMASVAMADWQTPLTGSGTNTIIIKNPRGEAAELRYIQIGVAGTNGGGNDFVAWLVNTNSDLSLVISNRIYVGTLGYVAGGVMAQTNVLSTMSLPVGYFWKGGDYIVISDTNSLIPFNVWAFSQK